MNNFTAKKVIVWGDSIAKGIVYDGENDKYSIIRDSAVRLLADKLGIEIVNRARLGMDIKAGLELADADLARGMKADAAVIEFGGNDCNFNWRQVSERPDDEHEPTTTIAVFEAKLRAMIKRIREAGIRPILASLPPIDSARYFDFISGKGNSPDNILRWLGDKNYIYRFHEMYSAAVNRIAHECGCRLFDFRDAFLRQRNNPQLFCRDGIHPNAKGQRIIYETVMAAAAL